LARSLVTRLCLEINWNPGRNLIEQIDTSHKNQYTYKQPISIGNLFL
jgi:hypothetical protein